MKKIALISVSDKTNIIEFSKFLLENEYTIISTSGTYQLLKDNNIEVTQISEITNFKEILDGRVKTLHPIIHGGLLADLHNKKHVQELKKENIQKIDLLVVNLYPFKIAVLKENNLEKNIIENIDIGGPTMLRSAAKNFNCTTVICDPIDYEMFKTEIINNKKISLPIRRKLAGKVFAYTAHYDACINEYFKKTNGINWYKNDTIALLEKKSLRYGENPHQKAMYFHQLFQKGNSIFTTKQLHGKELSYNNIIDANAAINIISEFSSKPTAVGLKHTNSCGLASASSIEMAWDLCYAGDTVSIFGGIVCLNRELTESIAKKMSKIFLEIIIAPKFEKNALAILNKKKNLRILELDFKKSAENKWSFKSINDGILIQDTDKVITDDEFKDLKCVTKTKYSKLEDLKFAWKVVKNLKSNGICITKNTQLIGIGTGQTNRLLSVKLAMQQNPHLIKNAILASDAFFPMADSIEEIAKADIKAIIQPGGSIKDQEVIDKCNEYNIAMYFVGKRHFLH